jgi:hypothetical protein
MERNEGFRPLRSATTANPLAAWVQVLSAYATKRGRSFVRAEFCSIRNVMSPFFGAADCEAEIGIGK